MEETLDPFREPTLFDGDDTPTPAGTDEEAGVPDYLRGHVPELFSTWPGDGEHRWADAAFAALRRAGLVHDGRDLDGVRNAMVLATLAALARQFYVHAWGEGMHGDWFHEMSYVDAGYPEVNLIDLGRLAEQVGVGGAGTGHEQTDLANSLVREFVVALAPQVSSALEGELGTGGLFESFWAIRSPEVEQSADGEAWEDLPNQPTVEVMSGYEWVINGMPL